MNRNSDEKLATAVAKARRALIDLTAAVDEVDRVLRRRGANVIRLLRMPVAKETIARQALGILKCLEAAGGKTTKADLLAELPGFITTVQRPAKVFDHYRGPLIRRGFIAEERP
ncbi:MAG: hypothetical protein WCE23_00590 [Candidatus Binatus sp.]|uniref:hypothetical protein n=1 Tax=Candidatus Binatus sp. TaxID=2811406 RepID=UPI003C76A18E